jgi:hypothetical protein
MVAQTVGLIASLSLITKFKVAQCAYIALGLNTYLTYSYIIYLHFNAIGFRYVLDCNVVF